MAIVLHRFPLSHYSEKGRALLEFKKLPFRIEEHQLGLPQLGIYRLSGQRKVPVIDDDGRVVADSTEIALYLEQKYPDGPRLLPEDLQDRRGVLALEDRLDKLMGSFAPVVWFDWVARDRDQLARLLALEAWGVGSGRALGGVLRAGLQLSKARALVKRSEERTRALLLELCERLEAHPYLCGDQPTLADVAAAGLAFHLELPRSRHLAVPDLAGVGVPGWADAPEYRRFFEWRRAFYERHLG